MMKFFRKHNKELLAFFMVALMIVFLGGSALNSLLTPNLDRVVATTRVGPISYQDQNEADSSTRYLNAFGLSWQRPLGSPGQPLELIDWIILTREAKRLGTATTQTAVRATLRNASGVAEIAGSFRVKPERVLDALADYESVTQTAFALSSATVPSEAALLAAFRESMEKAKIKAVMLPAEAFVDQGAPFTEDEIEAQYEQHREREAGTGLNFGYHVPPTLQVQYIKIDHAKLAPEVRVANLEKKAKALFDERKERDPAFRRPAEELARAEAAAAGAEGAATEQPSPYLTWEEAKDKAVELVKAQEANEAAGRMADWLLQSLGLPWLEADREKDGYKKTPESVTGSDYYTGVLHTLPPALRYPQAVSIETTPFFSQNDADDVPAIGEALFVDPQRPGRSETLGQLAFRTKAIVPDISDDKEATAGDFLSPFQTSRYALRDTASNVYLFRVVASRPAHAPNSLDEVRDKVVRDLRLIRGFAEAKRHAAALAGCDESTSLREAYDADAALTERITAYGQFTAGYSEPPPVARASQIAASIGNIGDTVDLGSQIGAVPADVVESWFASTRVEGEKSIVELKDRSTVMVVEWGGVERTKPTDLDEQRKTFTDLMIRMRTQEVIREWFDSDNIRARNGFKLETG